MVMQSSVWVELSSEHVGGLELEMSGVGHESKHMNMLLRCNRRCELALGGLLCGSG